MGGKRQRNLSSCAAKFHVNLIQAIVILEEGASVESMPPGDWPVGKPVQHFPNC